MRICFDLQSTSPYHHYKRKEEKSKNKTCLTY